MPTPANTRGNSKGLNSARDRLVACVDQILAAKQKNPAADTSALEREIDQQVYALYDLTPEERVCRPDWPGAL